MSSRIGFRIGTSSGTMVHRSFSGRRATSFMRWRGTRAAARRRRRYAPDGSRLILIVAERLMGLPRADRPRWGTNDDSARFNVLGDDCAGPYHSPATDSDPGKHDRIRTNPNVILNRHALGNECLG